MSNIFFAAQGTGMTVSGYDIENHSDQAPTPFAHTDEFTDANRGRETRRQVRIASVSEGTGDA